MSPIFATCHQFTLSPKLITNTDATPIICNKMMMGVGLILNFLYELESLNQAFGGNAVHKDYSTSFPNITTERILELFENRPFKATNTYSYHRLTDTLSNVLRLSWQSSLNVIGNN